LAAYVLDVEFLADAKIPNGSGIFFIAGVVLSGVAAVGIQLGFTVRDAVRDWRRARHGTIDAEVHSE
jgi:hypothetical protein